MTHPDDALLRHDDCLLWRHFGYVPEVGNVAYEATKVLAEFLSDYWDTNFSARQFRNA